MTSSRFAYAQARMQARHAERLPPALWAHLASSQSVERFLHAARSTTLSRWIRRIDPDDDGPAVEAALEREFSAHAEEVAAWVQDPWAPAVRWTGWLPVVPRRHAGRAWYRRFQSLWPTRRANELGAVFEAVERHLVAMRGAHIDDNGWKLRAELARELERSFRLNPATPAAVFSHLGLTLLELERLRAAILVRLLLPNVRSDVSWA